MADKKTVTIRMADGETTQLDIRRRFDCKKIQEAFINAAKLDKGSQVQVMRGNSVQYETEYDDIIEGDEFL
eukprot:1933039-Amphidinium_carterae.1